jgi:hypothetical protein
LRFPTLATEKSRKDGARELSGTLSAALIDFANSAPNFAQPDAIPEAAKEKVGLLFGKYLGW